LPLKEHNRNRFFGTGRGIEENYRETPKLKAAKRHRHAVFSIEKTRLLPILANASGPLRDNFFQGGKNLNIFFCFNTALLFLRNRHDLRKKKVEA